MKEYRAVDDSQGGVLEIAGGYIMSTERKNFVCKAMEQEKRKMERRLLNRPAYNNPRDANPVLSSGVFN